jgi:hypothetical protein
MGVGMNDTPNRRRPMKKSTRRMVEWMKRSRENGGQTREQRAAHLRATRRLGLVIRRELADMMTGRR